LCIGERTTPPPTRPVGPREDGVGQGRQEEGRRTEHPADEAVGGARDLPDGKPADQVAHELVGRQLRQVAAHAVDELDAAGVDGGDAPDQVLAHAVVGERLGEELGEEPHPHALRAQQRREPVVLLLGLRDPDELVEEQRVLVAGGQPAQLEVRPVEDHLPEAADLGRHGQGALAHAPRA
jgi:hypothetical protein